MKTLGRRIDIPSADGHHLAVRDWALAADAPLRGVVVIAHGLGEHAGRYARIAARLNNWGFWVRGYDQFGHGASSGMRGGMPSGLRLVDDLARIVDDVRKRIPGDVPLVLLGHSMGAQVATLFAQQHKQSVHALVLTSPAFDPGLNPLQKLLLALLPRLWPNLRLGNGLKPQYISHDPLVVQAYCKDPLVHDRVSARLAQFIAQAGEVSIGAAPGWEVPTLLLYAGCDQLINPRGSRRFAQAAPPDVVTAHCFEALYHEILNEPDAAPVYAALEDWLNQRVPWRLA